ncbi:carboxypeptidase S1 [Melampsora larici-populina 98AG31]|uniref:Carboxypeptidase n=1 Tax=Melampsora larici-populina (strain 98AG31 / pathotype 3-4-7) TaxID=747676 RepID=F4S0D3_MELLP|nr:carboxypeptidase S1 [Melampsora larici-populina 98AG31]EGG01943.1 carboxypeptidase S1 [Melampsora larici-populina 98AG31]
MISKSYSHWLTWTILCLSNIFKSVSSASILQDVTPSIINNSTTSKNGTGAYRVLKDSGICETTPGVKTYSGYIEVGRNQNMFFWFFEARNNPKTAPLTLWLSGGPGCSSMIGLFQENGPCTISPDGSSSTLNPYSWNEYSHMIYVDQPISSGFSYGKNDVHSTAQAAPKIWKFLQLLFENPTFSKYKKADFGLFTESYGGHYGPVFSEYFVAKNKLIKSGKLQGHLIRLKALGINNGWFDPLIQYQSYYDFSQAKYNGLFDLVDQKTLKEMKTALTKENGCLDLVKNCYKTGKVEDCRAADQFCETQITNPSIGNRNQYFFPNNASDTFPSISFMEYLARREVKNAIGAVSRYDVCPDAAFDKFRSTGDGTRTTIPALAKLLNQGLRTLIWAGDLDFICNWIGVYNSIEAMSWKFKKEFRDAQWKNLEIQGSVVGIYKTAGPLTFVRVFGAGHEVASYKPLVSLELFRQTMRQESIHDIP